MRRAAPAGRPWLVAAVVASLTYRLCVFPGDRPDRADAMVVFAGGDGEQ